MKPAALQSFPSTTNGDSPPRNRSTGRPWTASSTTIGGLGPASSLRPPFEASFKAVSVPSAARATLSARNPQSAGNQPLAREAQLGAVSEISDDWETERAQRDAADAGCDAPPTFLPARPITAADLAALTERVRRRTIRWFRLAGLLDAAAAAEMLAWENSGFSVDASVRITLIDRDVPSYFQSLEHLLRYCARPPFALERLSVIRGPGGRIARVRYVLPRHKAANWVGPGRGRKSTPRDTSRIAWAKLLARVGEEFPLACPTCGGAIRLIAFITEPGPIRKILTHLGEPLEPPPVSPARGPPTDWGELAQVHDDRDVFQASPDELPVIDIHSL